MSNHKGRGDLQEEEHRHDSSAVAHGGTSGTTTANATPKKDTTSYKTSLRRLAERSAKRLAAKQIRLAKYQKLSTAFSRAKAAKSTSTNIRSPEFQEASILIVKEMGKISTIILRRLKTPIAWALVIVSFVLLLGTAMPIIQRACQPFCIIPGISGSALCSALDQNSAAPVNKIPQQAEIATMVNRQSEMFEQLLESATGGSALSLEMKKAEMATKDLVVLVRISNLSCKDDLAPALSQFASDARATGRGLQKLAAKVGGAVNKCVIFLDSN